MRKSVKKLLAGLLVGAMALCATAPAFAADKTDTTGTYKASFYAYYDADKDGVKEWAPAPMGMDTGCIADGWTYDTENGEITLNFIGFSVYGMTGYITNITGDDVDSVTYGTASSVDGDGNEISTDIATSAVLYDSLEDVEGTDVQGIPATLSYSVLGSGMTQNMAVYLVIE